jgi:hypothetical protein
LNQELELDFFFVGFFTELASASGLGGEIFPFFTIFEGCVSSISSKLACPVLAGFFDDVGIPSLDGSFAGMVAVCGTVLARFFGNDLEAFVFP